MYAAKSRKQAPIRRTVRRSAASRRVSSASRRSRQSAARLLVTSMAESKPKPTSAILPAEKTGDERDDTFGRVPRDREVLQPPPSAGGGRTLAGRRRRRTDREVHGLTTTSLSFPSYCRIHCIDRSAATEAGQPMAAGPPPIVQTFESCPD